MSSHETPQEADHAQTARVEGTGRIEAETEILARLTELLGVVWRLRDEDGCPWDREQTLDSMASNLVEEAFETTEAIAKNHDGEMEEELGDVLMNVFLIARIAQQDGRFDLGGVAQGIAEKLVRRHPHVFGEASAGSPAEALASWNASKAKEGAKGRDSVLDGVPESLSGLFRAKKIGEKASSVGFDWPSLAGPLEKLSEEVAELTEASEGGDADAVENELGDVIFAAVNVARHHGIDPEIALRRTIEKFRRRFRSIEEAFGDGLAEASLDEMEAVWKAAANSEAPSSD